MKFKNTFKILSVIICVLLVISASALTSFADEATEALPEVLSGEGEANTDNTAAESIFETLYSELLSHSDKILSALAFVGSLIIAFTYKKGLLPTVKSSLTALIGGVKSLTDENEKGLTKIEESTEKMLSRLEGAEERLTALYEALSEIEELLRENEKNQKNAKDTKNILYSQVDMLYEIFMSSSLPEYKKDSVGKRINEMKKALCDEDCIDA